MKKEYRNRSRRTFCWPKEAHDLVRIYKTQRTQRRQNCDRERRMLVTKLTEMSCNPRDACWRFVRQAGIVGKREYRQWTETVQQRLLDLIAVQPLSEVAIAMHRSPASLRSMLHRLGASARMGEDWFTKYTLAEALHVRVEEIQRWIALGWLKYRVVCTGKVQREIIEADDFSSFCKAHGKQVVGRRLNLDRLNFVRDFVFPPSHAELLQVRESKKERAAYTQQMGDAPSPDFDQAEYEKALRTTA